MKKILVLLLILLSGWAFGAEPLLVIKPFRETFLNFPSDTLEKDALVVTVFLPEEKVPLRKDYPVLYVLGLGPKQAEEIKKIQDNSAQKILLVGIELGDNAQAGVQEISTFISRELVPYMDANYLTIEGANHRGLAVCGAEYAQLAAELLQKKELFSRYLFLNLPLKNISLNQDNMPLRILLAGDRESLTVWQETLEDKGLLYGNNFVTKITKEDSLSSVLDIDYLFSEEVSVQVKKLSGSVYPQAVSIKTGKAYLSVYALLANGSLYDYIPLSLRMSPPYLSWSASSGELAPISGAERGKVKIRVFVDKIDFGAKISLKK